MQDTSTGRMVELNPETLKGINWEGGSFKNHLNAAMKRSFQKAVKEAGIAVEHQGPVFTIDEIVELKGSKFKVRGFEGGLLHLEGVPKGPQDTFTCPLCINGYMEDDRDCGDPRCEFHKEQQERGEG